MPTQKSQRKRWLVDEFQYRLLTFNLVYFFIILLAMAAALFVPLMIKLDNSTLPMDEREEVANLILSLHTTLWPTIAIVFILLAVHSVFVSHRIAGALYRFRAVFREIAQGNFSVRATLRKRDYLTKEAAELNAMIDAVGGRLAAAANHSVLLQERIVGMKTALQRGELEACQRQLAGVDEQLGRLREALASVTTADGRSGRGGVNGSAPSAASASRTTDAKDDRAGR
jgi:methyl-accepting chemotaxis protein